jgi:hypothetical protein
MAYQFVSGWGGSLMNNRELTFSLAELNGIVSGILADGVVNDAEIWYLDGWLRCMTDLLPVFPVSLMSQTIHHIVSDGVVSRTELATLKTMLQCFSDSPGPDSTQDEAFTELRRILHDLPKNQALTDHDLCPLAVWWSHFHRAVTDHEGGIELLKRIGSAMDDRILSEREVEEILVRVDGATAAVPPA